MSLGLTILLAAAAGGAAQDGKMQMELLPTAIDLSSRGKETHIWLILRNPTHESFSGLRLAWIDLEGVRVTLRGGERQQHAPVALPDLGPGQELAYALSLMQERDQAIAGAVPLLLDYRVKGVSGVVTATLVVKSRAREAAEQVVDVQVKTTLESLDEHHPGKVYLVITNKSDTPLDLKPIKLTRPKFLQFGVRKDEVFTVMDAIVPAPAQLSPRETRVVPIDVQASERVQQGKYLLVFEVPVAWTLGSERQSRTLVATQIVTVGVFGESELLKLLAVPSFLILPGFLIVGAIGLLWRARLFRLPDDSEQPILSWLQWKSEDFWIVSVTFSFVAVALYSLRQNLLVGYGFSDVVLLWFLSLVTGAVVYVLYIRGHNWRVLAKRSAAEAERQRVEEERRLRTPSTEDEPIDILEKLHRQGLSTVLPRVRLYEANGPRAFLLQKATDAEKVWVGPRMEIRWLDRSDTILEGRVQAHLIDHDAGLKTLREAALGLDALPGIRFDQDPYSIVTVLNASGKDAAAEPPEGQEVHLTLNALSNWPGNWREAQPDALAQARRETSSEMKSNCVLYTTRRGQTVWCPVRFGGGRSLSCYHCNQVFALMQTESLCGLVSAAAAVIREQGPAKLLGAFRECTELAAGLLGALYGGARNTTYCSSAIPRHIQENDRVKDIELVRRELLEDGTPLHSSRQR